MRGGISAGSDKQYFSDEIWTLSYKPVFQKSFSLFFFLLPFEKAVVLLQSKLLAPQGL